MNNFVRATPLVFMLLVLTTIAAEAQPGRENSATDTTRLNVSPHLATDRDTWTVGFRYDAAYRRDMEGQTRSWFAELASEGRFLAEPALNTEPLEIDLAAGLVVNFVEAAPLPVTNDPDDVETQPIRDYGRLDAALTAGYETDQTLDNQQVTAGLEAGYVSIKTVGIWGWVPSLVVSARGVFPLKTEAREAIGADTDAFVSLRGVATIAPRIGELLPVRALKPLVLHIMAEGHWELGTGKLWREADLNTSGLIATTLLYAIDQRIRFVDQVYARWSRGRVPPNTIVDNTWTMGILLHPGS